MTYYPTGGTGFWGWGKIGKALGSMVKYLPLVANTEGCLRHTVKMSYLVLLQSQWHRYTKLVKYSHDSFWLGVVSTIAGV